MLHCVILGAGLLGRLVALRLAGDGHRISVFEAGGPDDRSSAASVAAAMLAPLAESAVAEPMVAAMGLHGLDRWPQLLQGLRQPVFFQREGTLVVWHRQDAAEAARFAAQLRHARTRVAALLSPIALDATQIGDLEPELAGRFQRGLLLPDEGQLDNRQLLAALRIEIEALGVDVHWHSSSTIADRVASTLKDDPWLIDCRGLGARAEWSDLRGVRGEIIRLYAPEVALTRPVRLLHPRYPLYIAPKPDHLYVVGASEIEADDMSPISVRTTLELLSAAYTVHTGFAEARILETAAHCRPALPDNQPAIRRIGQRMLQINGLYRHGFLIAPALVDVVAELIDTGESALAAAFGLGVEQEVACA